MKILIDHIKKNGNVIKWCSLSLFFVNICVLIYNLKTLNFWDDEVNGYYLSILDSNKIIELYSQNIHEDPLLFNYLLHFWMDIFGEHATSARFLSLTFWVLTGCTVYILVKTKANSYTSGFIGIAVLCLLPYHWLYPVAARWYSLSGLLVVSNLTFLYKLFLEDDNFEVNQFVGRAVGSKREVLYIIGYILSGSLLWYTNYVAPAFFLASLIVILLNGISWSKISKLSFCYLGILIAYIPWIETFISQVFISSGGKSASRYIVDPALSIYVLMAGETSLPQQLYISLPALLGFFILVYLSYVRFQEVKEILVFILVPSILMSILGVLWTKYMMLLSPILCVLITVIIHIGWRRRNHKLIAIMLLSFGVAWAGSASNMFSRDDWLAARWLDPYQEVVDKYESRYENSLFVTDSQTVFYYRGCRHSPLVKGNDKHLSGSYKKCRTTSTYVFKNNKKKMIRYNDKGKYVLILGGYSSRSESRIKRTLRFFKENGFNVLAQNTYGKDDMLTWKEMVVQRNLPEHRVYVYVLERGIRLKQISRPTAVNLSATRAN